MSFAYASKAEKNVLEDVNLTIKSGEVVGIIGGTGSSKSSLVNLIARLYDVTAGTVRVGGIDVRDYDLDALRGQVAMVLQKNELFSGTIAENLRWGDAEANDAELVRACELACANEFIDQMPDGYQTMIEQGGTNVSGGQKQRLCIARAWWPSRACSYSTTPRAPWTPKRTQRSSKALRSTCLPRPRS